MKEDENKNQPKEIIINLETEQQKAIKSFSEEQNVSFHSAELHQSIISENSMHSIEKILREETEKKDSKQEEKEQNELNEFEELEAQLKTTESSTHSSKAIGLKEYYAQLEELNKKEDDLATPIKLNLKYTPLSYPKTTSPSLSPLKANSTQEFLKNSALKSCISSPSMKVIKPIQPNIKILVKKQRIEHEIALNKSKNKPSRNISAKFNKNILKSQPQEKITKSFKLQKFSHLTMAAITKPSSEKIQKKKNNNDLEGILDNDSDSNNINNNSLNLPNFASKYHQIQGSAIQKTCSDSKKPLIANSKKGPNKLKAVRKSVICSKSPTAPVSPQTQHYNSSKVQNSKSGAKYNNLKLDKKLSPSISAAKFNSLSKNLKDNFTQKQHLHANTNLKKTNSPEPAPAPVRTLSECKPSTNDPNPENKEKPTEQAQAQVQMLPQEELHFQQQYHHTHQNNDFNVKPNVELNVQSNLQANVQSNFELKPISGNPNIDFNALRNNPMNQNLPPHSLSTTSPLSEVSPKANVNSNQNFNLNLHGCVNKNLPASPKRSNLSSSRNTARKLQPKSNVHSKRDHKFSSASCCSTNKGFSHDLEGKSISEMKDVQISVNKNVTINLFSKFDEHENEDSPFAIGHTQKEKKETSLERNLPCFGGKSMKNKNEVKEKKKGEGKFSSIEYRNAKTAKKNIEKKKMNGKRNNVLSNSPTPLRKANMFFKKMKI